jgi:hypothetical protein
MVSGLKVCRPYRAKTKGKVERFNGYLKGSLLVPLAATLKSAGWKLDVAAANAHVGRWLTEVANARVHATTGERPDRRLALERSALLPLPQGVGRDSAPASASIRPIPLESLQHPLSVYDALLEALGMNLQHERIATLCTKLKLERVAAEWTPLAQEAARNETSYAEFLERLLKIENDAHRASAPDAAQARHAAGGQDAGTV